MEEPNVLVLLGLEEFLSMARNYKQVRMLMTFVLLNTCLDAKPVFCHLSYWQEGFGVGGMQGFTKTEIWV